MRYRNFVMFGITAFFTLGSCSVSEKLKYSIQAGINKGGVTENTDMSVLPGETVEVDAFTGATKTGFNIGVRTTYPLKRNQVETGVDYMLNRQTFYYADEVNSYNGTRELAVSQVMVPLTYNFVLLKKLLPNLEMNLKLGAAGQYNFISESGTGNLPSYKINPFSAGATIGFAAYPVKFSNGNQLGFFVDGYRGSRIYEDFYNQPGFEIPGSSFTKFGITFQFK